MLRRISKGIRKIIAQRTKNIYKKRFSSRYNGQPISIISSNCIGGIICNRIGQPQNSPTFNLWIPQRDFIKFISDLPFYLKQDLVFKESQESKYPVAFCGDVQINFQHYKSVEDAKYGWEKRKSRIIWDNLFIIMYEDDLNRNELQQLSNVICKKIIVLTSSTENLDLPFLKYIKRDKRSRENSEVFLDFDFFGRRTFEKQWDYVEWLNS